MYPIGGWLPENATAHALGLNLGVDERNVWASLASGRE
ncbi:hypothetical protein RHOER0001_4582 [Rhodococcus erythropolis SK121]|nr:hypothetical protein RHOER0001_4582 [Rhodococcus erythropolis SK121]